MPNNDRLFPGWLKTQMADFGETGSKWCIGLFSAQRESETDTLFEVQWMSVDVSWLHQVSTWIHTLPLNDDSDYLFNGAYALYRTPLQREASHAPGRVSTELLTST